MERMRLCGMLLAMTTVAVMVSQIHSTTSSSGSYRLLPFIG